MTLFKNSYDCPCGTHWTDDWDCMCDDRCPSCNTSCSPTSSVELVTIDSMALVMDYIKMDARIMASITDRMSSRNMPWNEAFKEYEMQKPVLSGPSMRGAAKSQLFHELYGVSGKMTILDDGLWFPGIPKPDEGLPYDPMDFYEDGDRLVYGTFHWPSTEKDWERIRFVAGGETPPDAKKRAQLKAKRKKR